MKNVQAIISRVSPRLRYIAACFIGVGLIVVFLSLFMNWTSFFCCGSTYTSSGWELIKKDLHQEGSSNPSVKGVRFAERLEEGTWIFTGLISFTLALVILFATVLVLASQRSRYPNLLLILLLTLTTCLSLLSAYNLIVIIQEGSVVVEAGAFLNTFGSLVCLAGAVLMFVSRKKGISAQVNPDTVDSLK